MTLPLIACLGVVLRLPIILIFSFTARLESARPLGPDLDEVPAPSPMPLPVGDEAHPGMIMIGFVSAELPRRDNEDEIEHEPIVRIHIGDQVKNAEQTPPVVQTDPMKPAWPDKIFTFQTGSESSITFALFDEEEELGRVSHELAMWDKAATEGQWNHVSDVLLDGNGKLSYSYYFDRSAVGGCTRDPGSAGEPDIEMKGSTKLIRCKPELGPTYFMSSLGNCVCRPNHCYIGGECVFVGNCPKTLYRVVNPKKQEKNKWLRIRCSRQSGACPDGYGPLVCDTRDNTCNCAPGSCLIGGICQPNSHRLEVLDQPPASRPLPRCEGTRKACSLWRAQMDRFLCENTLPADAAEPCTWNDPYKKAVMLAKQNASSGEVDLGLEQPDGLGGKMVTGGLVGDELIPLASAKLKALEQGIAFDAEKDVLSKEQAERLPKARGHCEGEGECQMTLEELDEFLCEAKLDANGEPCTWVPANEVSSAFHKAVGENLDEMLAEPKKGLTIEKESSLVEVGSRQLRLGKSTPLGAMFASTSMLEQNRSKTVRSGGPQDTSEFSLQPPNSRNSSVDAVEKDTFRDDNLDNIRDGQMHLSDSHDTREFGSPSMGDPAPAPSVTLGLSPRSFHRLPATPANHDGTMPVHRLHGRLGFSTGFPNLDELGETPSPSRVDGGFDLRQPRLNAAPSPSVLRRDPLFVPLTPEMPFGQERSASGNPEMQRRHHFEEMLNTKPAVESAVDRFKSGIAKQKSDAKDVYEQVGHVYKKVGQVEYALGEVLDEAGHLRRGVEAETRASGASSVDSWHKFHIDGVYTKDNEGKSWVPDAGRWKIWKDLLFPHGRQRTSSEGVDKL